MKRRLFVQNFALGTTALLAGCHGSGSRQTASAEKTPPKPKVIEWKMVTTWPKGFPGLGTGAEHLASLIGDLTGGAIRVRVYGAGELAKPFEIFDAVSAGRAEMGHGAAYYWQKKIPAAPFFAAVPFGLNGQETNAWLYQGGGMELWQEAYAPYGLIPTAAGNTGVQMGGWFNRRVDSVADLRGLRMRIPGLGGEVLNRLGGTPVSLPGGEIFSALKTGNIDATEWVGPYNDLAFGFYKAARYYYYPGWHEPGTCIECFINKDALQRLPAHLKPAVLLACKLANYDMLTDLTARNSDALEELQDKHHVEVRRFPDEVLREFKRVSDQVVGEMAGKDDLSRRIYASYTAFRDKVSAWHKVSEAAYYHARAL